VISAQKKADTMKKHGILLLLAAFLLVAPTASAADYSTSGFLESWLGRLVAFFTSDELGSFYPPGGLDSPGGDPSEIGSLYPPGG